MSDELKKEQVDGAAQQGEGVLQNLGGKAKEAWGALTNDTGDRAEGIKDQVVGTIKEKVGEFRQDAASEADKRD